MLAVGQHLFRSEASPSRETYSSTSRRDHICLSCEEGSRRAEGSGDLKVRVLHISVFRVGELMTSVHFLGVLPVLMEAQA